MVEPESKHTLNQILDSAQGLFIQYGYHGLSMRQVAGAVGVTKAALYYYFTDKEHLFLKVLQNYLEEMEKQIDQINADETDSRVQIRQLVKMILNQRVEQRALIRLANQDVAQLSPAARQSIEKDYQTRFISKISKIMEDGMDRGELRRLDPEMATRALLGMLYPFLYPVQPEAAWALNQRLEELLVIYLHGISQPGAY